jgi:hypothetical protein
VLIEPGIEAGVEPELDHGDHGGRSGHDAAPSARSARSAPSAYQRRQSPARGIAPQATAAVASLGAGAIHAAAIGIHSEHRQLAVVFTVLAVAQLIVGLAGLLGAPRAASAAIAAVNAVAVGGWIVTRATGIRWLDGLEVAEPPQFADTTCAALGLVAAIAALVALTGALISPQRAAAAARHGFAVPAVFVVAVAAPAMIATGTHSHAADAHAGDAHAHDASAAATTGAATASVTAGDHTDDHAGDHTGDGHSHDAASGATTGSSGAAGAVDPLSVWPRPWDPAQPIDFTAPGVTAEQQARAEQLVRDTLRELPRFADVTTIEALGFRSIGDASTGFEHYVNIPWIGDGILLDPAKPESLVYRVDGDRRTLVSAMFITDKPIDDPELTAYGGPLMQWHVHENLCWGPNESGEFVVKGVLDDSGDCPAGSVRAGGGLPMVHVWITPHECGPFAALEGHGAGQVAAGTVTRTDQCAQDHGAATASEGRPYDPTLPIDLGGMPGVTPEQQAFAENLVATTVVRLPQWADPAVAEAAGFRSIGDGLTGHEHYIQWDWINDDVWLDPDRPESLVYAPQPDGTKRLVSAMYMLPDTMALTDVPDWGGPLMQWHIHDNLCFTNDPEAPQVASVIPSGGRCPSTLQKLPPAPMIHVWITKNECGPFAALEGVGAGQVAAGEERLCDHVHGSTGL